MSVPQAVLIPNFLASAQALSLPLNIWSCLTRLGDPSGNGEGVAARRHAAACNPRQPVGGAVEDTDVLENHCR
jgi:hypothetical protein